MIHRYCVWALALFFALDPAVQAKEKEELPTPPPMALTHSVATYRGRSVQITLRAIGRAPGQLKFLIRTQPRFGKLSEITLIDRKNAVVTYTHDDRHAAGLDNFSFAVQAPDSPVSAPASITIAVSEEPPAFSVVHALDFGSVLLGETKEDEIILRNTGGNTISGKVTAPAPWKILGSSTYQLGRHQDQKMRVLFEPTENAALSDRLMFSHDGRTAVTLTGTGVAPLSFDPDKDIELTTEKGTTERKKELIIRNLTDRLRIVEIEVPENIVEPKEISLSPQEEKTVTLTTNPDFIEAIDGKVTVSSEGFRREIPLKAYALEPSIQAEPADGFNFGEVQQGRRYKDVLRLKNTGGLEAKMTCDLPSGVLLTPNPNSVVIAPGETRAFELAYEPNAAGDIRSEVVLKVTHGQSVQLPITAQSAMVASATPGQVQPSAPAKIATDQPPAKEAPVPEGSVPAIKDIKVLKSIPHEVDFGWVKPAPNALGTIVEYRQLEPNGDGPPKVKWVEWRGAKFFEENGLTVARFDNLPSGRSWYLRIFSVDELGKRSAPSQTIVLLSQKVEKNHLIWWLLGLAGAVGAGFTVRYFYRGKMEAADEEADRIARLEKS